MITQSSAVCDEVANQGKTIPWLPSSTNGIDHIDVKP